VAYTLTQVQLGTLTLAVNPSAAAKPRELLQSVTRSIDGTLQVTYIPSDSDPTKIKTKRRWDLSGTDPDGSVIENIEAEIIKAPPLAYVSPEGESLSVAVEGFDSSQAAEAWESRDWKLSLVEV